MPKLTKTELRALERMWSNPHGAEAAGAFGRGIGPKTLDGLVQNGLATRATDRFGELGYAITEAGSEAFGTGRYE